MARRTAPTATRWRSIATPVEVQRLPRCFIAALVTLRCNSGEALTTPRCTSLQLRRLHGNAGERHCCSTNVHHRRRAAPCIPGKLSTQHRRRFGEASSQPRRSYNAASPASREAQRRLCFQRAGVAPLQHRRCSGNIVRVAAPLSATRRGRRRSAGVALLPKSFKATSPELQAPPATHLGHRRSAGDAHSSAAGKDPCVAARHEMHARCVAAFTATEIRGLHCSSLLLAGDGAPHGHASWNSGLQRGGFLWRREQ